ncbi:MAG: hypothetical protein Q9185_002663 [Variospora sp. 1 TL-2023]
MIRMQGPGSEAPAFSYVKEITASPDKLKELVDTDAAIKYVRSNLVKVETFPFSVSLLGATSQQIAHHPRFSMSDDVPLNTGSILTRRDEGLTKIAGNNGGYILGGAFE